MKPPFEFCLLVFTGKISYGLYLWHYPIFKALIMLGFDWKGLLSVGVACSFIAATFSYYLIEKKVLLYKKLFV